MPGLARLTVAWAALPESKWEHCQVTHILRGKLAAAHSFEKLWISDPQGRLVWVWVGRGFQALLRSEGKRGSIPP